jgi:hypothetical protein
MLQSNLATISQSNLTTIVLCICNNTGTVNVRNTAAVAATAAAVAAADADVFENYLRFHIVRA